MDWKHDNRGYLRIFASYYRPHWKLFALDMVCALLICIVDLLFPVLSRYSMQTLLPGQAFAAFDDAGVDAHPDTEGALTALGRGDLPGLCERMENVFEELCQSQPQLEQVLQVRQELCRQGALAARMSGSGSAVFGVFADPQQAMDCADRLEAAGQVESVHLAAPWAGGPVIEWEQSE